LIDVSVHLLRLAAQVNRLSDEIALHARIGIAEAFFVSLPARKSVSAKPWP
jgi:hypothetical protein